MKKNNRVWRFLYKLHRYAGLFSAIILLMLAITGIALNHTEDLKLDSQMIQSSAILDWYGISPPNDLTSFSAGQHWLTLVNQQIYFNHTLILKQENQLLGAVKTDDFIVVALSNSLLLLSLEGELIEQSPFKAIDRIGIDHQQQIIVQSDNKLTASNDGLLSWHPYIKEKINWSASSEPPEFISQSIKNGFRTSVLPMERVLLDIHSGRFFGFAGVILVDISGVLLIILALSGCSIWLKHKLRALRRR
jgi:hypothetical protein